MDFMTIIKKFCIIRQFQIHMLNLMKLRKSIKRLFFQKLKEDYIQKQAEWKNDEVFINLPKDIILIFDAALISKNHKEFEYRVNKKSLRLSKKEIFLLSVKNLTDINIFLF